MSEPIFTLIAEIEPHFGATAKPIELGLIRPNKECEVNVSVSQTISDAPSPAWDGTYSWDSKYTLIINFKEKTITAKFKIYVSHPDATKSEWESAIESKWNNKRRMEIAEDTNKPNEKEVYKIKVEIKWVDNASEAHYTVRANAPSSTEGGRSGVGGTTSMIGWGIGDTVDVPHEFGHMFGNKDEYYTIDDKKYGKGRQTNQGVMNNPSENPHSRHFNPLKKQTAKCLGILENQCEIINT